MKFSVEIRPSPDCRLDLLLAGVWIAVKKAEPEPGINFCELIGAKSAPIVL